MGVPKTDPVTPRSLTGHRIPSGRFTAYRESIFARVQKSFLLVFKTSLHMFNAPLKVIKSSLHMFKNASVRNIYPLKDIYSERLAKFCVLLDEYVLSEYYGQTEPLK
jgi:hypothetical protein